MISWQNDTQITHSAQMKVVIIVHSFLTSTNKILIGVVKISQMGWLGYWYELLEKSEFDFPFKISVHKSILACDTIIVIRHMYELSE